MYVLTEDAVNGENVGPADVSGDSVEWKFLRLVAGANFFKADKNMAMTHSTYYTYILDYDARGLELYVYLRPNFNFLKKYVILFLKF